jgi:hypothetical protein
MRAAKIRAHRFKLFPIAANNDEVVAVSGQDARQFEANPARGTGNQSRPLFRTEVLHEAHLREDVS